MYLSREERDRRYLLVRKAMAKEDIDLLLVVGNGHATGNPKINHTHGPLCRVRPYRGSGRGR